MNRVPLAVAGVLLLAGVSLAVALPDDGLAGLLDLTAERLPAPPELRLLTPRPGEGVGALVQLTGTAASEERDVIDVQYRVDAGRWQSVPAAPRGQPLVPFSVEVALPAGDHTLEARAWDGEAYSLPARVDVRRDAPTVSLLEPRDGMAYAGSVPARGTVDGDAAVVLVEAAGRRYEAAVTAGAWEATLDLPAGVHEVRARALGPVASLPQSVRVRVDGPSVTVLSPENASSFGEAGELACASGCIRFAGTSERAVRIDMSLDGAEPTPIVPVGDAWSHRHSVLGLTTGPHHATFTAYDADGRASVPREVVFLARTPRELLIQGDLEPRPTGTPLRFGVTGPDASTTGWILDGAPVGEGSSVTLLLETPGDHTLLARTQPSTGTASTAAVTLHARNRAPSVAIHEEGVALGGPVLLEATSGDDDGAVVSYRWEFGDGTGETTLAPQVTHRFAARGLHLVNLTATDDHGATGRTSQLVLVPNAAPHADFSWEPAEPTIFDAVTLNDTSRDLDGTLVSRSWTLPNGSTTGQASPALLLSSPGEHAVALTVMDDDGGLVAVTKRIHVRNLAPNVSFSHTPLLPLADEDVVFADLSVDPESRIVSWRWDLGDGNISDRSALVHRYADPGAYNVTLTVTDHLGLNATLQRVVRVVDGAPILRAVALDPPEPRGMQDVVLRAIGSDREGALVELRWDFGDGTNATGFSPMHRWPRAGLYHATLEAVDEAGLSTRLPFDVRVANSPPVPILRLTDGGYAGFPSLLVAEVEDVDGDAVLYRFDADGDGEPECASAAPRCAFTYPTAGVWGARLWVADDAGAIGETQAIVEMLAPPTHLVPPTVRVDVPVAGGALVGERIVRGDATGVRPILKVELQLQQGAWAYSGSHDPWRLALGTSPWSSLLDTRPFPDGTYDLVVRATDAAGGVGYARVPVEIANGGRPTELSVQVIDVPELLLGDALARGSAYHPLGVSNVRWRVDEGSWRFIGTSPLSFAIPLDVDALGPGLHTLQVEAFRGTTERAATNATFRVPGAAPTLVVDEAPPPIAHGLLRAAGRVVGPGNAQWKLDHGLWRDLPAGDWLLAEETMGLPGGPHEVHLRAMGPEGLASNVTTYAFRVVNPGPLEVLDRGEPPVVGTRGTPLPWLVPVAALGAALLGRRR